MSMLGRIHDGREPPKDSFRSRVEALCWCNLFSYPSVCFSQFRKYICITPIRPTFCKTDLHVQGWMEVGAGQTSRCRRRVKATYHQALSDSSEISQYKESARGEGNRKKPRRKAGSAREHRKCGEVHINCQTISVERCYQVHRVESQTDEEVL